MQVMEMSRGDTGVRENSLEAEGRKEGRRAGGRRNNGWEKWTRRSHRWTWRSIFEDISDPPQPLPPTHPSPAHLAHLPNLPLPPNQPSRRRSAGTRKTNYVLPSELDVGVGGGGEEVSGGVWWGKRCERSGVGVWVVGEASKRKEEWGGGKEEGRGRRGVTEGD